MTFGEKSVVEITTGDIEAYRHHRGTQKRSAVTINHDLKLLRKMFAWGIRERMLTATPFRAACENVIRLDPESPREERLTDLERERKLIEAASPASSRRHHRDARNVLPARRDLFGAVAGRRSRDS